MQLHQDQVAHDRLGQRGALAHRERDVVVDTHRIEERAILKQHAELPANRRKPFLAEHVDALTFVPDLAAVGTFEPNKMLE